LIKKLEEDLGAVLFVRSTRVLKLTDDGVLFYRDCVQILQKLSEATQRFRKNRQMPHGRLKIGMAPSLPRRILLRAIPTFQKRYPNIEVILLGIDDVDEIEKKGVDVLVRARSQGQRGRQRQEPDGMVVRKLAQSRRVVCASPDYLKQAGSPGTPTDLLRHACIAFVSMERDVLHEWVFVNSHARQRIKFTPKLQVHSVDAVREAAVAGCGIISLTAWNIEDELCSGTLVPILTDWRCGGAAPLIAIYRKTVPMLPQVSLFVQYLAEAFQRYSLPAH
jgi:LysR family transcriptional regulator for bpeEF and oprC